MTYPVNPNLILIWQKADKNCTFDGWHTDAAWPAMLLLWYISSRQAYKLLHAMLTTAMLAAGYFCMLN